MSKVCCFLETPIFSSNFFGDFIWDVQVVLSNSLSSKVSFLFRSFKIFIRFRSSSPCINSLPCPTCSRPTWTSTFISDWFYDWRMYVCPMWMICRYLLSSFSLILVHRNWTAWTPGVYFTNHDKFSKKLDHLTSKKNRLVQWSSYLAALSHGLSKLTSSDWPKFVWRTNLCSSGELRGQTVISDSKTWP